MSDVIGEMVNRFLSWPLPDDVCVDAVACQQGAPHRAGTNLLTAAQARQMIEHVCAAALAAKDAELDTPLPCDVRLPGGLFGKGVRISTLVKSLLLRAKYGFSGELTTVEAELERERSISNLRFKELMEWKARAERAEAEAAGLRADAERYRVARAKVCIVGDAFHVINLRPTYVAPDAAIEFDAAIDAARGES